MEAQERASVQMAQDLYSATAPFLYFCKLLGFSAFRLGTLTVVRRSYFGTAYTLLVCCFFMTSVTLNLMWNAEHHYPGRNGLYITANILTHCVRHGLAICTLLIHATVGVRIWGDFCKSLAKAKLFLSLDHKTSLRRIRCVSTVEVIVLVAICVSQVFVEEWRRRDYIVPEKLMGHSTCQFVFLAVSFKYANFAYWLTYHFNHINQRLSCITSHIEGDQNSVVLAIPGDEEFPTSKSASLHSSRRNRQVYPEVGSYNPVLNSDQILTMRRAYDLLIDVLNNMNRLYSIPVLFIVLYAFSQAILGILAVVNNESEIPLTSKTDVILHFCHMIWLITPVFIIPWMCQQTLNAANLPVSLINTITLQSGVPSYAAEELHKFSQQVEKSKPAFSAGGLFTIDMTLLLSFIGTTVTYLVILVDNSPPPNCPESSPTA